MAKLAYGGAGLIPVAVSLTCLKKFPAKYPTLFSKINFIADKMNSVENLGFFKSGYFVSQKDKASNPNLLSKLLYMSVTSTTHIWMKGKSCEEKIGSFVIKSTEFNTKLLTLTRNGFKIILIRLANPVNGFLGPLKLL